MKDYEGLLDKIEKVLEGDSQYKFEAYSFLMAALHHTVSKHTKPRHVTGPELLEGIREYAIEQYGPMAKLVLNYWGIYKTIDFGKIVFALVDVGVLRKQPEDKIDDFKDVYAFDEAFSEKAAFFEDEN